MPNTRATAFRGFRGDPISLAPDRSIRYTTGMVPTIRPLTTQRDFLACVELQRATWGAGFEDRVPPAILQIAGKMGGVAAGAFDESGSLLGFVFGFTGWIEGELCHWSHMLAVRSEHRDSGIGTALKAFQHRELLSRGVGAMFWTFDPLVARNAHINIGKLGVQVWEYARDVYGTDQTSETDSIIGSDRFVVRWAITGTDQPPHGGQPKHVTASWATAPLVVALDPESDEPVAVTLPRSKIARVEIPLDIQSLKQTAPETARRWRTATREALESLLSQGYHVSGFQREPAAQRCFYHLTAHGEAPS